MTFITGIKDQPQVDGNKSPLPPTSAHVVYKKMITSPPGVICVLCCVCVLCCTYVDYFAECSSRTSLLYYLVLKI